MQFTQEFNNKKKPYLYPHIIHLRYGIYICDGKKISNKRYKNIIQGFSPCSPACLDIIRIIQDEDEKKNYMKKNKLFTQ